MAVWFIILWLLAPIGLIPAVVILAVQNSSLKKRLREKEHPKEPVPVSAVGHSQTAQVLAPAPVLDRAPVQELNKAESAALPEDETSTKRQDKTAACKMAGIKSVVPVSRTERPAYTGCGNVHNTQQRENGLERAALIAGVLLILIASLIFVTTTWHVMPGWVKAMALMAVGGVFFLASFLAGKVLKLSNTSIAFYVLGCLSVPVTFSAVSFFQLWGEWFSAEGGGQYALYVAEAGSLTLLLAAGYFMYHRILFQLGGWLFSLPAVFCLGQFLFDDYTISCFLLSIYCLGIITWKWSVKQSQWLLLIQPLMWYFALSRGHRLLLEAELLRKLADGAWRNAPVILGTVLSFFLYWSGHAKIKGKSLRSVSSDILFPAVLILWAVWEASLGRYGTACLAVDGGAACLAVQSWTCRKKEWQTGTGTAAVLLVWFYYYPLSCWLTELGLWGESRGFLIYYGALTLAGIIFVVKRSCFSFLKPMELPAVLSWGVCSLIGVTWYGHNYVENSGWESVLWVAFFWFLFAGIWFMRYKEPYRKLLNVAVWLLPPLTGAAIGYWQRWPAMICVWLVTVASSAVCWGLWKRGGHICCRYMGIGGICLGTGLMSFVFVRDADLAFWWGAVIAGLAVLSVYVTRLEKLSGLSGISVLGILPAVNEMVFRAGWRDDRQMWVLLAAGIVMAAAGRLTYPRFLVYRDDEEEPECDMDWLSMMAVIVPVIMIGEDSIYWSFWGIPVLILFLLNGYGRSGINGSRVILTASAVLAVWAWAWIPYWNIPKQWQTEYLIAAVLAAGFSLRYIWTGEMKESMKWVFFVITVIAAALQGMECLWLEELWDVIVLGSAMTGIMMISYYLKRKRWLLLSFVTLTGLVLYQSRNFWLTIQWWVYLLAAGLLLIGTASIYEYKRRAGKEKKEKKDWLENWRW
ncbi:hypothetical protein [Clostridium sp. AM58-1XD]|uniref:hypothetical protein n=1 Tax=Clostridium sp. AM58-1XD TaxID=2292307 RepID=UPI000E4FAE81|nr:hypothetical protein [Clostridium sp. AM58-1XD]RGY96913.1 hypothetical protein DXA13_15865 [Clostridium sp. AM58-1XD]